jgi:hypothetical protein
MAPMRNRPTLEAYKWLIMAQADAHRHTLAFYVGVDTPAWYDRSTSHWYSVRSSIDHPASDHWVHDIIDIWASVAPSGELTFPLTCDGCTVGLAILIKSLHGRRLIQRVDRCSLDACLTGLGQRPLPAPPLTNESIFKLSARARARTHTHTHTHTHIFAS